MKDKEKLLKELEEEYGKLTKERNLSVSLEDFDKSFHIRDYILEKGYVGTEFSAQLRIAIFDLIISWDNYLHSLLMPNHQNLFNMHEAKAFDEKDKKEIMKTLSRAAYLLARNHEIKHSKDKEDEIKLIEDSYDFWTKVFSPFLLKSMKKVKKHWEEETSN